MSHCLGMVIGDEKLQIQELVQLWVNLKHLKEASPHLEKYISRMTRCREGGGGMWACLVLLVDVDGTLLASV